jgi:7,8-dihydropterin-6-yl-methyl-4-(beta-D-ribofuranosyl)aminobenzene 5'-phosphate synthase
VLPLEPVDELRLTVVVDNYYDFLLREETEVLRRPTFGPNPYARPLPMAEHGFSVLLRARAGDRRGTVMFDTGVSGRGLLYNVDALELRLAEINAIVLSHGHADHALGMVGLLQRLGTRGLPLVLHPDAYLERKNVLPDGREINLPPPKRSDLLKEGVELIEEVGPSMLVEGMVLVSGEVARTTPFETIGMPFQHALRDGHWHHDPMTHDDQCAIANVRGKGLVVVTGCGHSGIVNVVRNAQAITGVREVHAVIGGFHLSGPTYEPIIAPTIAALQEIGPTWLMPGHCTGWRATHAIARTMPDAFIQSSVGTTLIFGAN